MAEETDSKEDEVVEEEIVENELADVEGEKSSRKKDQKSSKETKEDKEIKKLRKELDDAKSEAVDLKDQYLRKQADFENFRKRMFREKDEAIKFANTSLLNDIIGIIDNFERALQSSEESKDFEAFHSGVEMIEKQMIQMLDSNWGLKRYESAGESFDPEKHEALMMEDSDEYEVQTVVEDFVKGYILHDRVIRPAKVKVANPVPKDKE